MRILGVIPARGGSKGIPGKNLREVAGKPLLGYTVDAVRDSRRLTRTILSTDDAAIAEAGRTLGVDVPFMRPPHLGDDSSPMLPVLQHAVDEMALRGFVADAVVLLQPTSPLRRSEHIDAAIELLIATGADSVVSVVEVPHQFRPVSLMALEDGRLVPLEPDAPHRRQDKPVVYARNGPAVLALRPDRLGGDLYGSDCRPYVMDMRDSVDIDEEADLRLAELYLHA